MKITEGILRVKSDSPFYEKEESGRKRNTVRSLYSIRQDGYTVADIEKCDYVMITKAADNSKEKHSVFFARPITDISWFYDTGCKETFLIVSW